MPKATIYEDRQLISGKNHVCPPTYALEWASIHAVSQAFSMEQGTQGEFRLCILTAIRTHDGADLAGGCSGLGGQGLLGE